MVELDSSAAGSGLSRATSSTSRPAASTVRRRLDAGMTRRRPSTRAAWFSPRASVHHLATSTAGGAEVAHAPGRGMSSPEIPETGHTMPDMMDLANKRPLVRCAELRLW